jgi:mRNA interferase MazF
VSEIGQGDIWLLELPDDKPRPALVITRDYALGVLRRVTVARVTTTIRQAPTQLPLGRREGLDRDCVANFDDLAVVSAAHLTVRLGVLGDARRQEMCAAVNALVDC